MTLRELGVGEPAVVLSLGEGHPDDVVLVRRMAVLGVRPGEQIEVLKRTTGGARIIGVRGARLAVDGRTAARIHVRRKD